MDLSEFDADAQRLRRKKRRMLSLISNNAQAHTPAQRRAGMALERAEEQMTNLMLLLVPVTLGALIGSGPVAAVEPTIPNLTGTYRCVPDTRPCQSSTFSI